MDNRFSIQRKGIWRRVIWRLGRPPSWKEYNIFVVEGGSGYIQAKFLGQGTSKNLS
jgi:hypothetical protein